MRLEGNEPATINTSGDGIDVPPPGLFGGQPGQPHEFRIVSGGEERPVPSKATDIPLRPGDVLRNSSAGGGGYGDPCRRTKALIAQDLRDGLITPAAAQDVYGLSGLRRCEVDDTKYRVD